MAVSATWGARCGKSARRVLRGGTGTRDHAGSVRPRSRKGPLWRGSAKATAPRSVPTSHARAGRIHGAVALQRVVFEVGTSHHVKGQRGAVRHGGEIERRIFPSAHGCGISAAQWEAASCGLPDRCPHHRSGARRREALLGFGSNALATRVRPPASHTGDRRRSVPARVRANLLGDVASEFHVGR